MTQLFDLEVLEQHGYTFDDGNVTGPPSWPRGAPPRLGNALDPSSADSGGASERSGSSEGGGSISRAEARCQIRMSRAYADWLDAIRKLDVWKPAQKRRAWMLGQLCTGNMIKDAELRELVRQAVAKGGDKTEIELWSEDDVRADYTLEELGEGA